MNLSPGLEFAQRTQSSPRQELTIFTSGADRRAIEQPVCFIGCHPERSEEPVLSLSKESHEAANPKPGMETKAALLNCHPEPAKDLTTRQPALCHDSPCSKLTAPHDEPSVPITGRLKRTSGLPSEIPSTDSGQALRKLPMNLPVGERRSAPTARPHTSLGQRPTAIKLRNSRSRSQAPARERPGL